MDRLHINLANRHPGVLSPALIIVVLKVGGEETATIEQTNTPDSLIAESKRLPIGERLRERYLVTTGL